MTGIKRSMMAAAGSAGGGATYVEDVFSTYLYTGTEATLAINNGIDLDGEGGMVWIKNRETSHGHRLFDTERGVNKVLESYDNTAEATLANSLTVFNSNGFTVGSSVDTNKSGDDLVGWTFRKAPGFFDVVTWTGDNTTNRAIPHNLEEPPGMIIVKSRSHAMDWPVYSLLLGNTKSLTLNTTATAGTTYDWAQTDPTSTNFYVHSGGNTNYNGYTYVAYLFAHDDQMFGADEDESIIKCGQYTGNGTNRSVSLGWEPQYVLIKNTENTDNWWVVDMTRGAPTGGNDILLQPNSSGSESDGADYMTFSANGFTVHTSYGVANESGSKYIYMAIRRPMKVPEAGTEVFAVDSLGDGPPGFEGVFTDWAWKRTKNTTDDLYSQTRLTGAREMKLNAEDDEGGGGGAFDYMNGWLDSSSSLSTQLSWMFKRAAGFMDIVNYVGNSSASGQVIAHNLTVEPEMIIIKNRTTSGRPWHVYAKLLGDDKAMFLTETTYASNNAVEGGTHNATQFELKQDFDNINGNGKDYLAILFATLAGVSKVGMYTADATVTTIDCGFSAGARFILIKKKGSGNWYYWDSTRGIVAGDDPYLVVNTTAAEVTTDDWIDPHNSGFQITDESGSVSNGVNIDTEDYLFLAIA